MIIRKTLTGHNVNAGRGGGANYSRRSRYSKGPAQPLTSAERAPAPTTVYVRESPNAIVHRAFKNADGTLSDHTACDYYYGGQWPQVLVNLVDPGDLCRLCRSGPIRPRRTSA